MPAALASVLNKVRKLETDAAAEYAAMVRTVAGDREVEVGELLDTIGAAGRTREDFERDVERLAARLQARTLLDQLDARTQKRDRAERKVAALTEAEDDKLAALKAELDRQYAAAKAARDAKVAGGKDEVGRLTEAVIEAQGAYATLMETAPADLIRRRADLLRRRAEALAAAERELPERQARLARIDELLKGGVPPERNEHTHPFGGGPIERERALAAYQNERRVRIRQVETLEAERPRVVAEIRRLEALSGDWAEAVAACERDMLSV